MTSKLIDGRYPDWRKVLPGDPVYRCHLARLAIKSALAGALAIGDGQIKSGLLSFGDTDLALSSTSITQSEFSTEIGILSASGRASPNGYNLDYLSESAAACDGETLSLAIADDGKLPLTGAGNSTHVIMPMRI